MARRSGSPNLVVKTEVQPVHQQQAGAIPASTEARQWPDAKQELLDKFFRSHSTDRRNDGSTITSSIVSKTKATSAMSDPVAEIYARLPPIDPSVVASMWKEEIAEPETEERDSTTPKRPVINIMTSVWFATRCECCSVISLGD